MKLRNVMVVAVSLLNLVSLLGSGALILLVGVRSTEWRVAYIIPPLLPIVALIITERLKLLGYERQWRQARLSMLMGIPALLLGGLVALVLYVGWAHGT